MVGYTFLNAKSSDSALNIVRLFVEKYKSKFLVLHPNASAVGSLDLGFETDHYVKQKLMSKKGVQFLT